MTEYQKNWHYLDSTQLLPEVVRQVCERSYQEMTSSLPMHRCSFDVVGTNLPERYLRACAN